MHTACIPGTHPVNVRPMAVLHIAVDDFFLRNESIFSAASLPQRLCGTL
jgi:hypothetical protein